jgi:hypothetical protein
VSHARMDTGDEEAGAFVPHRFVMIDEERVDGVQ